MLRSCALFLVLLFLGATGSMAAAGPFITGQAVLKRGGLPISGAAIALYKPGETNPSATSQSLQNGSYFLRAPCAGSYRITAAARDCAAFEIAVDVPAGGLANLKLELSGPPMIRLNVTGSDGKRVAAGVVQVWLSVVMAKYGSLEPTFTFPASDTPVLVLSDAPWIPYDSARDIRILVRVAAVGYAQAHLSGWPPGAVALQLQPGAELAGRAMDAKGKALAGAVVILQGAGDANSPTLPRRLSTLTAKDGRFHITALPYGKYTVETSLPGGGRCSHEITLDKEKVEITLRP